MSSTAMNRTLSRGLVPAAWLIVASTSAINQKQTRRGEERNIIRGASGCIRSLGCEEYNLSQLMGASPNVSNRGLVKHAVFPTNIGFRRRLEKSSTVSAWNAASWLRCHLSA